MHPVLRAALAVYLVGLALPAARAQQAPPGVADSLRLGALHRTAEAVDPRQRQFALLAEQTALRLRNLAAERLPGLWAEGGAQYQSDVFAAPAGTAFPSPPRDTYDVRLRVELALLEPTIGPRRRVAEAELAEDEAEVRQALYGLRDEVNDAFFSAALLAERGRLIAATIGDLESQLQEARLRVLEGVALPSDTAVIRAVLLERRQDQAEIEATRGAALSRLADLTGRAMGPDAPLALPDLAEDAALARRTLTDLRARPEYARFARSRDRLSRQAAAVSAELLPHVSAFGRAGYGRPGLNPVSDRWDSYYVIGLEVRWTPWTWGSTGRERRVLAIQGDIVAADEAAFTGRLGRAVQGDLADMDRLDTALALDDQIVLLRERVETETRIRFREGAVTASEFLDRGTDALEARLTRAAHRVEQVRARARLLTILGLEIR